MPRIAGIAAAALLCAAGAVAGVVVEPSHIYIAAAAGSRVEVGIDIVPTGVAPTVAVALTGFEIDANGNPRMCAGSSRSISGWAASSQPLPAAHLDRPIRVSIVLTVPTAAEGSYWGTLAIDTDESIVDGVPVSVRMMVPIILTVPGTERPAARFSAADVSKDKGEIVVSGLFTNSGNTVLSTADVRVRFGHSTIPLTTSGEAPIVLPGASRAFVVRIPCAGRDATDSSVEVRLDRADGEPLATVTCPLAP